MAVDKQLVACLLQLNGLEQFAPYRKHLQEQREQCRDALETQADSNALKIAQGRAQAYKEILDLIAQAPALAKKYRE